MGRDKTSSCVLSESIGYELARFWEEKEEEGEEKEEEEEEAGLVVVWYSIV